MRSLRTLLTAALVLVAGPASSSVVAEADSVPEPDSVIVPPVDSTEIDTVAVDSSSAENLVPVDTVLFTPGGMLAAYSSVSDTTNRELRLRQKPMWGLFKSMVLPGWGQLGNGRPIKAAVYLGLEAWMVGGSIHYGGQATDFRRAYDATPHDDLETRNEYYALWRDRADERNKYTWFAVIVAFVSMFDAYVDAHLSGFPSREGDEDLSLELAPTDDQGMAAQLTYRF